MTGLGIIAFEAAGGILMLGQDVRLLLGLAVLHVLGVGTLERYIDAGTLMSFQLCCSGNVKGEL